MSVSKPLTNPWEDIVETVRARAEAEYTNHHKPIVHFGNKIWAPALAAKHDVQLPVERLITISTFDLVLMRWVEVEPCQR